VNKPNILIISNKLDFTTDYVCLELQKRNAKYFRINRDEFDRLKVVFNVTEEWVQIESEHKKVYLDNQSLKAIYYRAPIYLRDIYRPNISKEEQLFRTQWTAFIRNLNVFEKVIWVNNPASTFKAENKILQLKLAKEIGFQCPKTIVTNTEKLELIDDLPYIVKSLDTAVLRIDDKEAFVYSNIVTGKEIKSSNLRLAPIILQEYIYPKIDVRVTVIGGVIYAVRIIKDNRGIDEDWRKEKQNVKFVPFKLPESVESNCIELVKRLDLSFGAIDLIESNHSYYFIELNPTGEWAWLVETANLKIYEGISDFLEGKM